MKKINLLTIAAGLAASTILSSCCCSSESKPPKLRKLPCFSDVTPAPVPVTPGK